MLQVARVSPVVHVLALIQALTVRLSHDNNTQSIVVPIQLLIDCHDSAIHTKTLYVEEFEYITIML